MDLLYEHVYDNADPIQGVTDNSSWLKSAGEDKITRFDGHRTTTDLSRRLRSTNRILDPIEHLPPELSTFVITQALPPPRCSFLPCIHSSRLIELTTVSKKWQTFLFSTPVLWSELVIDETQEDFLATLSLFMVLSSKVPLTLTIWKSPIDWTGLAAVLLPVVRRIAGLRLITHEGEGNFDWLTFTIPALLEHLDHLPFLKELHFDQAESVELQLVEPFKLPPTVNFKGIFGIELPEGGWMSGTPGRFFDTKKYHTPGISELIPAPLQSENLSLDCSRYRVGGVRAYQRSDGATLPQLNSLARSLAECNCFEQFVYTAAFKLRHLRVDVNQSQLPDLLDSLRVLIRLQHLELDIFRGDSTISRDYDHSNIACHDLTVLEVDFHRDRDLGVEVSTQRMLRDMFSAFKTLYPCVESLEICGNTWTFFASSYIQSLGALKSLTLGIPDASDKPPEGTITLQSLQFLRVRELLSFDSLHMPNLLKLELEWQGDDDISPINLSTVRVRSLHIILPEDAELFDLSSLECQDLRDLHLTQWVWPATRGSLSLSNLVSIRHTSELFGFLNASSNQLCVALLCYPERLPSLRQLHFDTCVDLDILFLMLKRRNCDISEVQSIDTVTLPFIPFAFHKLLARLLAGEIVELPSLISLSLEATREVVFDSNVPGCFACLKNMRPGCTERVVPGRDRYGTPAYMLYPIEDPAPEETPQEIQDWLSQRWELVEMWKVFYEEFILNFTREGVCDAFPNASLLDFSF